MVAEGTLPPTFLIEWCDLRSENSSGRSTFLVWDYHYSSWASIHEKILPTNGNSTVISSKNIHHQKEKNGRYLEPNWPLFFKVNPPKQGPFQSKQGSFGF